MLSFDLLRMLDNFSASLTGRAHEQRPELICAGGPSLPNLLVGDSGRLGRILTNLAGNAIKSTLPLVAAPAFCLSQNGEEFGPRFSMQARILLVEDNIVNQKVALGILKKIGLQADAVANGLEALKALESLPYDLVLMDVQMPVMDGLETTRRIRLPQSHVLRRSIPIIAMTAQAMQDDQERCLAAGMNDYISKPVEPKKLIQVIERWLPDHHLTPEIKSAPIQAPPSENLSLVFNRNAFLRRLMGDEDLAQMIIVGFLDDIPIQIQELKKFLEAGNSSGAERQAHTIKGASANLGGEALSAAAFEIEKYSKAGDLAAAAAHLPELEKCFDQLKQILISGSSQ